MRRITITFVRDVMKRMSRSYVFYSVSVIVLLLISVYTYAERIDTPTERFPVNVPFEIEEGKTASEIAEMLEEENVVRSSHYLAYLLRNRNADMQVQAASYIFPTPLTAHEVAHAITHGEYKTPPIKITFPEGLRGETMLPAIERVFGYTGITARTLDANIGYLFPDTYYINNDTTPNELLEMMQSNFNEKTRDLSLSANTYGLSEEEVVILASIVEREANDVDSKRKVAGTLLNRLEIEMPLQVDATLYYLLDKTSAELTYDDLEYESEFNTYTNLGLPPHAIANPGLDSIIAVLDPIESNYLYFLTGNDGNFYYAETHDQHVENKFKYLR